MNVSFLVGPERVLIEVQDEGEGFDPREVPDPLASENLERSSGRGLHLISAVARAWGCIPLDAGKVVWAAVALPV